MDSVGLTVSLALVVGLLGQVVASHLSLPAIVVLLVLGVVFGPDVLGLIQPQTLGSGLSVLVSFAVAVVLFEGSMTLNLQSLRSVHGVVRRLITVGAAVTFVGATLAAKLLVGFDWQLSILFGTLVIVTGPTVVAPIVRRIRLEPAVGTVLEGEGILIDSVGAIVAAVVLELSLSPSGVAVARGLAHIVGGLGLGTLLGLGAGILLTYILGKRGLVPERMRNMFVLAYVLVLSQVSNALLHESGLAAVTVAGLVVGNSKSHAQRQVLDFKEQLTVLLIGMLFVLLTANVRLHEVHALGWGGVGTVLILMFVVRPASVWLSARKSNLNIRQKAMMAWVAPRGIVAAAVASFFATELSFAEVERAQELQALVFLVIAVTVTTAGITSGSIAKLLRLRRPSDSGWIILGANALARRMGDLLGDDVVFIDRNPFHVERARAKGRVVYEGDAFSDAVLDPASPAERRGVLAITPNKAVNLLFAQRLREERRVKRTFVVLHDFERGVTTEIVQDAGSEVLFGMPIDLEHWSAKLEDKEADITRWTFNAQKVEIKPPTQGHAEFVIVTVQRGNQIWPMTLRTTLKKGDEVMVLFETAHAQEVTAHLAALGFVRPEEPSVGLAEQTA